MVEDVFSNFDDPDGNFIEQFQTSGFDARFFELYMFAYLSRSGFTVQRPRPNPDFVVSSGGIEVAIEATTVNPSTSGVLADVGKKIAGLYAGEIMQYIREELPIRFGSPLASKMQRRYWELPQCAGKPFVLAIEAFHDEESLVFSDTALARYVYGLDQEASWTAEGTLNITASTVKEHTIGTKTVPSSFFSQPDSEHLSGILFTNSGTHGKFSRMGYQTGFGNKTFLIRRSGFAYNPDPHARDPSLFSYDLEQSPFVESWGQGLVFLRNPTCLHPVPDGFFPDALEQSVDNGLIMNSTHVWHPFGSKTLVLSMGDLKEKLRKFREARQFVVSAISRDEFEVMLGGPNPFADAFYDQSGWFADDSQSFYGLVALDKTDGDWGYIVFARDEYFALRPHLVKTSLPDRGTAVREMQIAMAELLESPQRIFPELNP